MQDGRRAASGAVVRAAAVRAVVGAALALAVSGALLAAHLDSPSGRLDAAGLGLTQLDMLYLDEPAPLPDVVGVTPGRPLLIVVCAACAAPDAGVPTTVTDDPAVAEAYALRTADGRVGPGYALVDGAGRVRYRTFDPGLAEHGEEIRVLVEAL